MLEFIDGMDEQPAPTAAEQIRAIAEAEFDPRAPLYRVTMAVADALEEKTAQIEALNDAVLDRSEGVPGLIQLAPVHLDKNGRPVS